MMIPEESISNGLMESLKIDPSTIEIISDFETRFSLLLYTKQLQSYGKNIGSLPRS